jgi:hypothetical protein
VFEPVSVRIDEFSHRQSSRFGRSHVLQTIVIGSALEPDVTSQKMVVACVGVSLDQLQRESDMGRRVDVGNRGRDVDDPTCSSAFPFEGSYAREAE